MRRIFASFLALSLAIFALPLAISAESVPSYHLSNFRQFQEVPPSSNYAVAAVAIQKFLMLYGQSYAQALMAYGADGFYGNTTKTQVQRFQYQECPHGGSKEDEKEDSKYGTVDTATWLAIASKIEYTDLIDTGGGYFHRFNRSYYNLSENVIAWNGSAYYAYKENSLVSTHFYPR